MLTNLTNIFPNQKPAIKFKKQKKNTFEIFLWSVLAENLTKRAQNAQIGDFAL